MIKLTRLALDSRALAGDLRLIDPGLFQPKPLPSGGVAGAVHLKPDDLQRLVRSAAVSLCGLGDEAQDAALRRTVLWRDGESDLLIFPGGMETRLAEGIVALSLPVFCDQTEGVLIHVSFFVGTESRPAGLVVATEERPRGPAAVVDVWGERVVALAWRVLLGLATQVAAESGRDEDGAPLLPVALSANVDGLSVLPMARHAMDRASA